jgi:hypothetical protein
VLIAGADGLLRSERALPTAFMAPRLQGEHRPEGVVSLSLWGAGALGRLGTTAMTGPYVYAPNRVTGADGALYVARSAPALVLRGARARRFTPAARSAAWSEPETAAVERTGTRQVWTMPWGCVALEQRGEDLVIAAGVDRAEAETGLALSVEAIVAEAAVYVARCDRLPEADPLLRSLVLQGTHAALSSVRRDAAGAFGGLSAGLAYSAPARTYFRDGYWTFPMLFQADPEAARAQVELLAGGVRADGEAPSGVIVPGPQQRAWEARRAREVHTAPGDWWSDHFDSPLLFVLAVGMVAAGEPALARRFWPQVRAVLERYERLGGGEGLPFKPRHDRDWADNVFREGWVAYDLGLWAGALEVIARLAPGVDEALGARAEAALARLRAGVERRLWRGGWYADYATEEGSEDHLTLDSLTLLRFGAVPGERAEAVLDAVATRAGEPAQ